MQDGSPIERSAFKRRRDGTFVPRQLFASDLVAVVVAVAALMALSIAVVWIADAVYDTALDDAAAVVDDQAGR